MARRPRIEYEGGVYHIVSRGDRQEPIFRDDGDRQVFLKTLGDACGRTGWRVYCFVLMDNHYHLLIETPEANLVVGMKWLQGTYTQRFNRRRGQCGHVFQGRYKALVIESGSPGYLQTVALYIHLNPARAGLIDRHGVDLTAFAWSSLPGYVKPSLREKWLCVERVLGSHNLGDNRTGRLTYRRIVEEHAAAIASSKDPSRADPAWAGIRRGWYLGSQSFLDGLLDRLDRIRAGRDPASLAGEAILTHDEYQAEQFRQQGLARLGLTPESLGPLPKGSAERRVLLWYIRHRTIVSNRWLSEHIGCGHPANVPGYIRSVELAEEVSVAKLKARILRSED